MAEKQSEGSPDSSTIESQDLSNSANKVEMDRSKPFNEKKSKRESMGRDTNKRETEERPTSTPNKIFQFLSSLVSAEPESAAETQPQLSSEDSSPKKRKKKNKKRKSEKPQTSAEDVTLPPGDTESEAEKHIELIKQTEENTNFNKNIPKSVTFESSTQLNSTVNQGQQNIFSTAQYSTNFGTLTDTLKFQRDPNPRRSLTAKKQNVFSKHHISKKHSKLSDVEPARIIENSYHRFNSLFGRLNVRSTDYLFGYLEEKDRVWKDAYRIGEEVEEEEGIHEGYETDDSLDALMDDYEVLRQQEKSMKKEKRKEKEEDKILSELIKFKVKDEKAVNKKLEIEPSNKKTEIDAKEEEILNFTEENEKKEVGINEEAKKEKVEIKPELEDKDSADIADEESEEVVISFGREKEKLKKDKKSKKSKKEKKRNKKKKAKKKKKKVVIESETEDEVQEEEVKDSIASVLDMDDLSMKESDEEEEMKSDGESDGSEALFIGKNHKNVQKKLPALKKSSTQRRRERLSELKKEAEEQDAAEKAAEEEAEAAGEEGGDQVEEEDEGPEPMFGIQYDAERQITLGEPIPIGKTVWAVDFADGKKFKKGKVVEFTEPATYTIKYGPFRKQKGIQRLDIQTERPKKIHKNKKGGGFFTKKKSIFDCIEKDDLQGVLDCILRKSDDVDAVHKDGESALFKAVKGGNLEIVKLLLRYGAEANPEGESEIFDEVDEEMRNVLVDFGWGKVGPKNT
eukprot:snap_masked-scaffold_10-processed-gene-6.33-mRNA-1 protein AED:1.00 eAED:1.00 QI:0/-1/0/0/-1/1/1/0/738